MHGLESSLVKQTEHIVDLLQSGVYKVVLRISYLVIIVYCNDESYVYTVLQLHCIVTE